MKFRAKSPLPRWSNWAFSVLGAFNIILGIYDSFVRKPYSGAASIIQGVFLLLFALSSSFIPIFIYSEFDATYLRVHKFWKTKEIKWQEVTSAGRFGFGTDDVIVRFGHQMEDYGNIIFQTAERDKFLDAIHQYAPQAKIDV